MERRRFTLSAAQMSEGFAAARAIPANSGFLAGLLAASGMLPEELAGEDGALDSAARLAFETLARPLCSLRFLGFAEGSATGFETRLATGDGENWIAFARVAADRWDLALIGGAVQALALADEVLGASLVPDPGPGDRESLAIDLGGEELALLSALAQQARLEALRARLEGRSDGGQCLRSPIELFALGAIVRRERERPDPGSPLTRLAMLSGEEWLAGIDSHALRRGLEGLVARDLAGEGGILTAAGSALVELLASRTAMTLVQSARRTDEGTVTDELVLLHGPGSLLTGSWLHWAPDGDGEGGLAPGLLLRTARGGDLLMLLDRLLVRAETRRVEAAETPVDESPPEPVDEAGICDACGTLYPAGSRFCRECGSALAPAK